MSTAGEDRRERASEAFQKAQLYHQQVREIFEYYMPYRLSTTERAGSSGGGSEGGLRGDRVFDATGPAAAFNFAGTLQADWMPLNQQFFKLEAGPLFTAQQPEDQVKVLNEQLAKVTDIVHGVIQASVPPVVHEFAFDLFAGTGAMLLNKGGASDLLRPQSVPILEIAMEDGPWGSSPWRIWWKRKWRARDIKLLWPNGQFSDRLNKVLTEQPKEWIEIIQATTWNEKDQRWQLEVFADKDETEAVIWTETFRTSPWVITRFLRVPGETMGRGLGHMGLASVKTANKTRELALTAAALAVMGIFIYRDDGIFNPNTAKFAPLQLWPVSSTGGPLGSSIARLPVPQDFDVTSIVMQEERDQIRKITLDDEMPQDEMAVRSATEIAGRLRRYARRWGGVNTRLGAEWIVPTIRRTVDILEDANILRDTRISVDQLLTKCTITAPAMSTQKADRVEQAINYLQMLSMLFGPHAPLIVTKLQDLLPDIGRWMAIDERHLNDRKTIMEGFKTAMAMQQQASAPPPEAPPPEAVGQSYINGVALQ